MNMELPKKNIKIKGGEVCKNSLYIKKTCNQLEIKKIMYTLSYQIKGEICCYCGKRLNEKDKTIDHGYPVSMGGPTITNNLYPACRKCNETKNNYTQQQFRHMIKHYSTNSNYYHEKIQVSNEIRKRTIGYKLPKEWIKFLEVKDINNNMKVDYDILRKISNFYRKYNQLCYPVVVDSNKNVIFNQEIIKFSKSKQIERIPTIILENVFIK